MPTSVKNATDVSEQEPLHGGHSLTRDRSRSDQVDQTDRAAGRGGSSADVTNQVLASVEQSNQMILSGLQAWVDAFSWLAPNVVTVPFADEWRDAATASFDFAQELLELQRDFTARAYSALAPRGAR